MPGNAGEDRGEKRLRAGDATPCREDIGRGFEIRQAGRVIRRHEVDLSLEQRAPQAVAVTGVADRRRALERRALRREIVVIERQVVRTGLDGNVGAHIARRADRPERFDRRDMHDVDARTGFPRGRARGSHRPDLDERRPRLGPGSRVLPALTAHPRSRFADQRVVLAVERHDEVRVRCGPKRRDEIVLAQGWKLGNAAVAEERLDTDGPSLGELAQARRIGVDETAPEPEVDDRRVLRRRLLHVE